MTAPPHETTGTGAGRSKHSLTISTLRDAAALSMTGLLAKAMGLLVTILVARFHGPAGLGTFALLLSVTLLLEQASRFGVPELLIRDAGARPDLAGGLWRNGLRTTLSVASLPTLGLLVAAAFWSRAAELRDSLWLMAASMPLAAIAGVGQSVLQALGRAVYVTWVSFVARVSSLLVLVVLLSSGMGITAAFIARVVFEGIMALCFTASLRHQAVVPAGRQPPRRVMARSLPFAIGRIINEASLRAPLLCVSITFAMSEVGLFDSADRVGLSFQAIAAAGVVALIPVFSRSVESRDPGSSELVGQSLKYTSLLVSAGAYAIAAFAQPLVVALYGAGFGPAAELLPMLLLAQSLMSADAVLRQALFAHGREYALIGTGVVTLAVKLALLAAFSMLFGLRGAAFGVLLSAAATLTADLWLTNRARIGLDIRRHVLAPLTCVAAAFATAALCSKAPALVEFSLGLLAFAISAALLRVFPAAERRFLLKIVQNGLQPRRKRGNKEGHTDGA